MAESWASSEGVRRSMLANRSRDTGPELAIRKRVHAMGLRYRVSARPISGLRRTADLVFATERIAVFIDGCFWHGCPEHRRSPRANADYWSAKVQRIRLRDGDTDNALAESGWTVLRFWEHESPEGVAEAIWQAVASARVQAGTSPLSARRSRLPGGGQP